MSDTVKQQRYRENAQRMLALAAASLDPKLARRWRKLAKEYAALAEQLEANDTDRPPLVGRLK